MNNRDQLFKAPPFENHSPLTWYQAASQLPNFIRDDAQAAAIEHLDRLWTELMMFKRKRNRFLGRSLRSPQVPKGLYFYGGVGRGKSFLMDAFSAASLTAANAASTFMPLWRKSTGG
ncbi:Nucleotide-binding protein [Neisseria gonorrhoeae]|uniref:Nucleotide-binding protein n=1 Tax=Neisseria gonorrhoeae TaxID=485 RepID=A0A378VYU6_NEIGO|nr:Nucleotide-binding protein [Neisseria gonorrhoeae]